MSICIYRMKIKRNSPLLNKCKHMRVHVFFTSLEFKIIYNCTKN